MAIKKYKPTTPSRRHMVDIDYSELSKVRPEKSLTEKIKANAGRNNAGDITSRRRGGGVKRLYRTVDFLRSDKLNIVAKVSTIEYDPYRTAFIALVVYTDGEKRYILAPDTMKVGDTIVCAEKAKFKIGNRMHLGNFPAGQIVHCLQLHPQKRGQIVRSAGSSAVIMSNEGEYTSIKLPSGEIRKFHKESFGTLGIVSNPDHSNTVLGKAGRSRLKNRRPSVLGKSMNPVDHPHGGGEAHTGIGMKAGPKTPWGKPALGKKTRNPRLKNKMITTSRHLSKKKRKK